MNWVMILMFCAEPWLYDAVIHEREQTYHSTGMCLEPWSTGAKAVSFLPSRPCANLICGVEQLPKLAPEVPELVPVFDGVGLEPAGEGEEALPVPDLPTGFPVLSMGVTSLKLVLEPKNLLNTGRKFNRMKSTS